MKGRGALACLLLVSCAEPSTAPGAPSAPAAPGPRVGLGAPPDSSSPAVLRAEAWVAARVPYCQAPNHGADHDSSCPTVCQRPANPEWDAYRSDCAGFVSWAWGLPAPGRLSTTLAPFKTDVSHVIDGHELQPGDALNSSIHSMLFKQWLVAGQSAVFLEEPGCDSPTPYAHEVTASVSIHGSTVELSTMSVPFTAIRR